MGKGKVTDVKCSVPLYQAISGPTIRTIALFCVARMALIEILTLKVTHGLMIAGTLGRTAHIAQPHLSNACFPFWLLGRDIVTGYLADDIQTLRYYVCTETREGQP